MNDITTDRTDELTHDITDSLQETFTSGYRRGFREGWELDEFAAWLDEEIEVCHLQLHGEQDHQESRKLLGMLDAYENTAEYLERRGITVWGASR